MPNNKHAEILFQALVVVLTFAVGVGYNPASSAVALAIFFSYRVTEKYFHDSFHDENKKALAEFRRELEAVKTKQNTADLKSVFSGGRSG